MRKPMFGLTLCAFALSACGAGVSKREGASTAPAGFNATDACAILSKEKVAAITGLQVDKSTLSAATQPTASTPGFSACTYSFVAGGTLGFYARRSPEPDTPETIAQTRKAVTDGMGAKTADVAGIGTSAFSARPMDQLHVFFGGDKYIYFVTDRAPINKPVMDVERALAVTVIG